MVNEQPSRPDCGRVTPFCAATLPDSVGQASASGKRASQIGLELDCDTDTALNAINAFSRMGLECLTPGSPVPHTI
jgi:hypothetical protein